MSLLFISGSFAQNVDIIAFIMAVLISLLFYHQDKKYAEQVHYNQMIDRLFED
ncbi:MAG TPA: hypothetical protein VM888_10430 [Chitinophagaceae bacterium]|nr:hypothetical protein [Chitinophagaceae bacterium]